MFRLDFVILLCVVDNKVCDDLVFLPCFVMILFVVCSQNM